MAKPAVEALSKLIQYADHKEECASWLPTVPRGWEICNCGYEEVVAMAHDFAVSSPEKPTTFEQKVGRWVGRILFFGVCITLVLTLLIVIRLLWSLFPW